MTTHIKAFTYLPKIEAVRAGICRQTIRPLGKRVVKVGDKILFHGWRHRDCGGEIGFSSPGEKCRCQKCNEYVNPYSGGEWSWRLKADIIVGFDIKMYDSGFVFVNDAGGLAVHWDDALADDMARRDGIVPPTGYGLRDAFMGMHRLKKEGKMFRVIRWGLQAKIDI